MEGRQEDMGKLEIKKGKHNHIFTNLLKGLIFAVIMLAPFFSILSKCLYITFNKNAKDSYYGETINQQENIPINNSRDLIINKTYNFNSSSYTNISGKNFYGSEYRIYVQSIDILNHSTNVTIDFDVSLVSSFATYKTINDNTYYLALYDENNTSLKVLLVPNNNIIFDFVYLSNNLNANGNILLYTNVISLIEYNKYSYLDNAFIYSVNELHNQQIFNWTENTAIYTAINTMTTGLGFNNNNNTLALLLTYWALNTAVYIIFDIVIWAFTKLTHIMQE